MKTPKQNEYYKDQIVPYQANTDVTKELRDTGIKRDMTLHLSYKLTCTAANNTTGNTSYDDGMGAVKKIVLLKDKDEPLLTIPGDMLRAYQPLFLGNGLKLNSELGNGNKNPSVHTILKIPFIGPLFSNPYDTALWTGRGDIESLDIRVHWADHTGVNSNATGFKTDPTMDVYWRESDNKDPDKLLHRKFWDLQRLNDISTNSEKTVPLPKNARYAGIFFHTTDAGSDEPIDNVINNVSLKNGQRVIDRRSGQDLIHEFRSRYGVTRSLDFTRSDAGDFSAYGVAWNLTDGYLTEGVPAHGFSDYHLEIDQNGGSNKRDIKILSIKYLLNGVDFRTPKAYDRLKKQRKRSRA